jgi:hypothetical protein
MPAAYQRDLERPEILQVIVDQQHSGHGRSTNFFPSRSAMSVPPKTAIFKNGEVVGEADDRRSYDARALAYHRACPAVSRGCGGRLRRKG